jgi:iron complex transport system substrate-binding protein
MLASAFLLLASGLTRVASLNLCTDEYLLLLARPEQIVGVSYLSQDPEESVLWRQARRYKGNRGSIEDVLTSRPSLVLTMGGGGRATALLARRMQLQVIDLPYVADLNGVAANLRLIASALGQATSAQPWIARLHALEASAPRNAKDAIWISGGGWSLSPDSLAARWLLLAGLRQRGLPGGRASLETLLTNPPNTMIKSNYRSHQISGGERWLDNPIVRNARSMKLITDGRPWTCVGPLMIPEIERLRKAIAE